MIDNFQQYLQEWYATAAGRPLFQQEKLLVDHALHNLFGYFLVQLGNTAQTSLLENSRVKNKLILDNVLMNHQVGFSDVEWVRANLDFLPIGKESVDLVFLPHTLEVAADPYYLLRQVDSMLVPEGRIVITGFNPVGCAVLRHRWKKQNQPFKQANLERLHRVKEWLEVLGYDIQVQSYSPVNCFNQPENQQSWLRGLEWCERSLKKLGFEFGNVYCLVAKKRVDAPKLVGMKWKTPRWMALSGNGQVSSIRNEH